MTIGLVGRKVGMTRIFSEDGVSTPVTVLEVEANRVAQVKTVDNDGYSAIQVTTGTKKANRINKPTAGHFAKAGVEAGRGLWEFRLAEGEGAELAAGSEITVELFNETKLVDVTGTSKGKGFQGGIKRWNFRTQDMSHGNYCRIVPTVRSVSVKHQVVFSKAKKCLVTWVLRKLLRRTWN
jgi:large subunit ribosomal protein L3